MSNKQFEPHRRQACPPLAGLVSVGLLGFFFLSAVPVFAQVKDSCVDCHRNPDFLVQNKKLYDYFQDWELSVHKQEEVSCTDCHGGNPEASEEKAAHGPGVGEARRTSAVNFENIPRTCGECHEEILDAYRTSNHFEHLVKKKEEKQGPNCVTCHGSMATSVPDVETVGKACARCHNEEKDNNPETPDDARVILNKLLSIDRFYRYLSHRLEPDKREKILEELDVKIHDLSVRWHTFDLEEMDKATRSLLEEIKQRRDEVRKKARKPPSS